MQEDEKKSIYDGTPNDMTLFAFKLIKFCSILLGKKIKWMHFWRVAYSIQFLCFQ